MRLAALDDPVGVWHIADPDGRGIKAGLGSNASALGANCHAFPVWGVYPVLLAVKVCVLGVALNGSDPHGLRHAVKRKFPRLHDRFQYRRMAAVYSNRRPEGVCLFSPYHAGLQDVPEQDSLVLRLADAGNVRPIEALSALGADQGGVDFDGLDAQLLCDLRPDGRRHGFVIFVKEKIRIVLFQCDQVILEQLPADAAGLGLPVLRLGDAPMGAGGAAYE